MKAIVSISEKYLQKLKRNYMNVTSENYPDEIFVEEIERIYPQLILNEDIQD